MSDILNNKSSQSNLGRVHRYLPCWRMHSPTACASYTMHNITEHYGSVTEPLQSITEPLLDVMNVMEELQNIKEHYGSVTEHCGVSRNITKLCKMLRNVTEPSLKISILPIAN